MVHDGLQRLNYAEENDRVHLNGNVVPGHNILRGHITAETERGTDYLLRFRGDGPVADAGDILIHCSSHVHYLMKLQPGKPVWVTFPPGKLHLLATIVNP